MSASNRALHIALAILSLTVTGCTFVELKRSSVSIVDPGNADPGLRIEFLSSHDLSQFGLRSVRLRMELNHDSGFRHWADLEALGEQRKPIVFGLFERSEFLYAATIDFDLIRHELQRNRNGVVRCRMHQEAKPWPEAVSNVFYVSEADLREVIEESSGPPLLPPAG